MRAVAANLFARVTQGELDRANCRHKPTMLIGIYRRKTNAPVIDARAKQCCRPKSTHQDGRFYHVVMLPRYHGKVNALVNIHTACEYCHVTVVKHRAWRKARCTEQAGKTSCKSPVNGHRRPHKRTQGARRINTMAKGKARQNRS